MKMEQLFDYLIILKMNQNNPTVDHRISRTPFSSPALKKTNAGEEGF
jgi:hypothetical protein